MAQEVEIELKAFAAEDRHKIRNFLEALWLKLGDAGWTSWDDFDALFDNRVNPHARFSFQVTTRRKLRDALALVDKVVVVHMMGSFVCVTHRNVEDG